jgi:hypothetical protein
MSTLWFARDGKTANSGQAIRELPLTECVSKLGMSKQHYRSNSLPHWNEDIKENRRQPYKYVLIEISTIEANTHGWKGGFYYLPSLTPGAARALLG